jgi:hypothetical protein
VNTFISQSSDQAKRFHGSHFHGSYGPQDVIFLLKILPEQPFFSVADKEQLIQSGQRHYSEMLSPESLPSPEYLKVFEQAFTANRHRMANDCLTLASLINAQQDGELVLASLLRAGTPVGVILKHILEQVFKRSVTHYSLSIIRDRGIDENALNHILHQGHAPESIVFVDGWTGKGVISAVLEESIASYNLRKQVTINGGLFVLADLAGSAFVSASGEDYLIPSSILNATVSGLVSRSVLNDQVGANDFHGCIYYQEFAEQDQSQAFADAIIADAIALASGRTPHATPANKRELATVSSAFLAQAMVDYQIDNVNFIKPGIGEATRVLLRRKARLLILRDPDVVDVAHLRVLANQKSVPIIIQPSLPYQAVSLIGSALDG